MQSKQSGVTAIGFIIILLVIAFFAYMALKLVPAYIDYYDVGAAMKEMAKEDFTTKTRNQLRRDFMLKASFQYADQVIDPNDITFTRGGDGTGSDMTIAYDQRVHFVYNIDFLLHFKKTVTLNGRVD